MPDTDVLIVGAGLAGLTCARHVHRQGLACRVLEASDDLGGRVRTDEVEGFKLDHGFQVLQTAYPEAQRQLDYDALDLHPFYDGALIQFDGRFHRLTDPFRHLLDATGTIISPIGTFKDKLRVARVRTIVTSASLDELFEHEEITTEETLRKRYAFSDNIIDRFFRPFFGGLFFDRTLHTSSRMFDFVFRMLSLGHTALPAGGMQAIPRQIAAGLPEGIVQLGARVMTVDDGSVTLEGGERLTARAVVVATEAPAAEALIGGIVPTASHSTTCLYYTADEPPLDEPILILNGTGQGPINNVNLLSNVAPSYAPEGKALISVTILGTPSVPEDTLRSQVRGQLADWFGAKVGTWKHLRMYPIPYALPDQSPPFLSPPERSVRCRPGLYVCGDHRVNASIHGALLSGRRAAEAVLEDLYT